MLSLPAYGESARIATDAADVGTSIRQSYSAATIAGALAHELNNPLQGILSLLSVLDRECEDPEACRVRTGQIRSGLMRLKRIVESFSVTYENLPRQADRITVEDFFQQLTDAMQSRQLHVNAEYPENRHVSFYCLWPEIVRLVTDIFSLPPLTEFPIRIHCEIETDLVVVVCERDARGEAISDGWRTVGDNGSFSGLAVLIDEIASLGRGRADFRLNERFLDAIRLHFRTEMKA
ncbi:MAG: histidine kinase dimerization/phospho-acceptor domain-containing protein [bacterium]|nr:histidine kinase dimerization/phospho-acceptor domain-containing protein [bacterium]